MKQSSLALGLWLGLQIAASTVFAQSPCSIDTTGKRPDPFAFGDFTWLNGNARTKDSPLATESFTGGGYDAPGGSGSVKHGLHGGGIAVTLYVDTVGRYGQLVDVVLIEVELGGGKVFVESFEASSAGDGHDPRLSRQQPCQGDLSWGGAQAGSDRGDFVDKLEVAGQGFGGDRGRVARMSPAPKVESRVT